MADYSIDGQKDWKADVLCGPLEELYKSIYQISEICDADVAEVLEYAIPPIKPANIRVNRKRAVAIGGIPDWALEEKHEDIPKPPAVIDFSSESILEPMRKAANYVTQYSLAHNHATIVRRMRALMLLSLDYDRAGERRRAIRAQQNYFDTQNSLIPGQVHFTLHAFLCYTSYATCLLSTL